MAWKGCEWKRPWPELKYLTETTEKKPGGDSNWSPSESEPEILPREPTWSIGTVQFNLNSRLLNALQMQVWRNLLGETAWTYMNSKEIFMARLMLLSAEALSSGCLCHCWFQYGWLANQFVLTYLRQGRKCSGSLYSVCIWMSILCENVAKTVASNKPLCPTEILQSL